MSAAHTNSIINSVHCQDCLNLLGYSTETIFFIVCLECSKKGFVIRNERASNPNGENQ